MPQRHVAPEALEEYVLGHSSAAAVERIEDHLLICDDCRQELVRVEEFVGIIKRALAISNGVIELHATPDGPVSLRVYEATGGWLARVVGGEVDSGAVLGTRDKAVARCRSVFAQWFPEHACSSSCRTFTADGSPPMHPR